MRPYLALLHGRLRLMLQYRTAAWAGVGTQLFWGFIRVMIFEALYRSSRGPQPMSLEQTISYIWLGQATLALQMFGLEADTRDSIRSGNVAYELCRPADLYFVWFMKALAWRSAAVLLRAWPQLLLAMACLGLQPPVSAAAAGAWLVTILMAAVLSTAYATLFTVGLLWTISGEGLARLGSILPYLLSGLIVPLPLMPDWLKPAMNSLPFRGFADLPFRLWTGHLPASEVWHVLGLQVAWTLGFVLLGRWLLGRGLRRLVVQGG